MNAKLTIMQTTDWSRFSLEGWFRQFGAWINGDTQRKQKFYKSLPKKKLSQKQREELLVKYLRDESFQEPFFNKGMLCDINDNEARAFQKLVLDLRQHESDVLQAWLDVIWCVCVDNTKLRKAAEIFETSTIQIRQDMKCGLAFISGRYPNFKVDLLEK
ncbi:hypothetical protein GCM10025882_32010 [Acinetobacter gyllenbergii]|uniref:Phage antitermination protein Q n=1 Tax=Acinetobacter gyllenbergii CIP 110306 = MTCC 11365 TaxID=1217657 RepID=A0A829HEG4_9GAMM|nr:hypothetical protein [Acinetobacter gyllenbergii]EPF72575.1 hypothetical protein F957_03711 [Acinetobacter gyllenbergii CIP 110306 = MTCC 11365]EPH31097.1 hypothetical protein L293_2500 [Acinetobacter gyllenbergii CIP 110306 = MTCC 11365]GMA12776.1 hypothetical protein GCM10025882_32010 [Acinetobacter gyllenbergii]